MAGAAAHHGQTGEILAAVGAFQVAGSAILDYAVQAALDQTTATAFAVFVEQVLHFAQKMEMVRMSLAIHNLNRPGCGDPLSR